MVSDDRLLSQKSYIQFSSSIKNCLISTFIGSVSNYYSPYNECTYKYIGIYLFAFSQISLFTLFMSGIIQLGPRSGMLVIRSTNVPNTDTSLSQRYNCYTLFFLAMVQALPSSKLDQTAVCEISEIIITNDSYEFAQFTNHFVYLNSSK